MTVYEVAPGIKYYMDGIIGKQLEKKRQLVKKKDRDYFMLIDGDEGSGKSYLAFQIAKFLDPTFCLDRICFDGRKFLRAIQVAQKGQAIVFDEAFTGLSARSSMSEINKLLVETIMEVRKKNLFILIVLPSLFYLDKYVVLQRVRVLFHTYFKQEKRGRYALYDKNQIKELIIKGRKTLEYRQVRPKIRGRFTGYFALDKEGEDEQLKAYEGMKLSAIQSKGKNRLTERHIKQRNAIILLLLRQGFTQSQIVNQLKEMGVYIDGTTISEIAHNKQTVTESAIVR